MITNEFVTDLLSIANQAIMLEGKTSVNYNFVYKKYSDADRHYSKFLKLPEESLSKFDKARMESFLNTKEKYNEILAKMSNVRTYCNLITTAIYECIDKNDPDCALQAHPRKLLTMDIPSSNRLSVAIRRTGRGKRDKEINDIMDALRHYLAVIEKEESEMPVTFD